MRYSLRALLRTPGFTALAVLALALGMGANTAIFSIVNGVLIRPLPYPDPDRIVILNERAPSGALTPVSAPAFEAWQPEARSYAAMTAVASGSMALSGAEERVPVVRASAGFFEVFGAAPSLGRAFSAAEDRPGAAPVALLDRGVWERRFGADPGILGRSVTLDERKYTVIGILPAGFRFFRPLEVLLPLALDASAEKPDRQYLTVLGRLKPEVAPARARSELRSLAANFAAVHAEMKKGWSAESEPLHRRMTAGPRNDLPVLFGAAGFVLLIACANVASLLLARGAARRKEIAVRASLGASRWQLLRQLISESVLLAAAGGAAGTVLAFWVARAIQRAIPPHVLPPGADLSIDARVLAFTLGLALITGLLAGVVPAWRVTRVDLQQELKQGSRGSAGGKGTRLRSVLVVAEIALALVLTSGAVLMVRSLANAQRVRLGFDETNLLTLRVELTQARYEDPKRVRSYFRDTLAGVAALPGVRAAAVSTQLPLGGWGIAEKVEIPGRSETPTVHLQIVSPGYFRTMGIALRQGREFSGRDTEGAPRVAVVNEAFARRFFAGEGALGKRIRTRAADWEVAGVAESMGLGNIDARSPEVYICYAQSPHRSAYLSVRTAAEPLALVGAVRGASRAVDAGVILSEPRTMQQIRDRGLSVPRVVVGLIGGFGALALLLSVMGIYGLMSWIVTQRTAEFGIRAALGARSADLYGLVLRKAAKLVVIGGGIGLAGAAALTRLLRNMLYGVAPGDPATLAAAVLLLLSVAIGATWRPARRAARLDPTAALRTE